MTPMVERTRRRGNRAVCRSPLIRVGAGAAVIAGALMLAGCEVKYRVFEPVNPDLLESQLRLGVSKRADVQAALGAPTGTGRSMLPFDQRPRTMWSYWYEEGSREASGRTVIYVYFDEDIYSGYLWFSSLPEEALTKPQ